jgi:hypothetical protein
MFRALVNYDVTLKCRPIQVKPITTLPPFTRFKSFQRVFILFVLVSVNASATGQTNLVYAWRNLTGQPGGNGNADGTGGLARLFDPSGVAVDSAGNLYVADTDNNTIRKVSTNGVVTTLAGSAGQSGSADGTNNLALFNYPSSVAADGAGNVYVADSGNNTIRKVTTNGVVTTLAGSAGQSGSADGTNNLALFNYPSGVAVDSAGNVYVADSGNNTIRKVTTDGVVTTLAGSAGQSGSVDGSGSGARFFYPSGVAVDSTGNIYVADLDNNNIRKVTSMGMVTTLAGLAQFDHFGTPIGGSADGTGTNALFNYPSDVAVDNAGNVYVADTYNSTIRKITSGGVVTTLAGSAGQSGSADGTNNLALFNFPSGVAVDSAGNLYVADTDNNTIRKVMTNGVVTTLAGSAGQSGSTDVTGSAARFSEPIGMGVDSAGNVYVADSGNNTIRKVTTNGVVTTLAGSAGQAGSMDGTNNTARFSSPTGVAVDNLGNEYIADTGNSTIRKVASGGVVTTLAGSAGQSGSTDGTNSTALFKEPSGVAVDGAGNVYVADTGNSTIRKVTGNGVVTTLAGSAGQSGSTDGTNSTALFKNPSGVAVDSAGNVYVADTGNKTVRQVTSSGVVTTLAGSAGLSGSVDGTNSNARFTYPYGITVDNGGNLYVTDAYNSNIREVTSNGVVTTLAGSAGQIGSVDGIGSAARFFGPAGVAADSAGNLYVADSGNSVLRKVTDAGMVTTMAGSAGQSGSADDPSSAARYFSPCGVAVDSAGNVYVADTYNSTIRKVTSDGGVTTLAGSAGMSGSADGTNNNARFNYPSGVAVDSVGNVYVADTYNSTIRKVMCGGVVTTLAGNPGQPGSTDGTGSAALFNYPSGVAVDGAGNVYVADSGNSTIRMVTSNGVVTTPAGNAGQSGSTDGTGSAALFNYPFGVAVDGAGNVYVADSGNSTIRMVTSNGVVTTPAGNAGQPGSADGMGNMALFSFPRGVVVDSAGNVFVADTGNNTIRRMTSGGIVTTIGGDPGVTGGADGMGSSANFAEPSGIAVDGSDRVYVADAGNNRISTGTLLPAMSIESSSISVIVSWPAPSAGFVLQQNSDIGNASGWSNISYSISDDGTNKSITVSMPMGNQFFRLMAN